MSRFLKSTVALVFLGFGLVSPALAQSASEMAVRMQQLEEQVRQLMGQVEQLDFEVKQLRSQRQGAVEAPAAPAPAPRKKLAAAAAAPLPEADDTVESAALSPTITAEPEQDPAAVGLQKAPGPKMLGSASNSSAQPDDGGFQGQVLVPPSQQEPGEDAMVNQGFADPQAGQGAVEGDPNSIETVALAPETPEALYERSNESLLRRQFGDAEAGFSTFLSKYPEHNLAGSAQYWLGETYFAQGDFKRAAQNFLQGYKSYPKSRRAADSLLKLGISLNRLGQAEQACAAYAAVSAEYPKAVEARKRAQAEAKRASCGA